MRLKYRAALLSLAICLAASAAFPLAARSDDPVTKTAPAAVPALAYDWRNVEIVGGGFVPGIVFSRTQKGLAYARTDIGGAYRWDVATNRWIPLTDWVSPEEGYLLGIESIALDPNDSNKVYVAAGMYTNDWGGNASMLRSDDQGKTWKRFDLPFKMGGNEDGRSMGERLAVDPADGKVLYFGSRNSGLWRSTDGSVTWKKVDGFPVDGRTNNGGISFVLFDVLQKTAGKPSSTIYAGAAAGGTAASLYRSIDSGATWAPVPGQPAGLLAHRGELTPDGALYITYSNALGPNGISDGAVWKLDTRSDKWTNITPVKPHSGTEGGFGYGGLSVDAQHSDTLVVSTLDRWNPGDDIFRSTNAGKSWKPLAKEAVRDGSGSPFVNWGGKTSRFGWWIGCVEIDPFDSDHTLYGTGATIWGTNDLTASASGKPTQWTVSAAGLEETAVISLLSPAVGPHLISGLGDIGGFTHDDLAVTPKAGMTLNPMLTNTDDVESAGKTPNVIVRYGRGDDKAGHGGISDDAGETWKPFAHDPPGGARAGGLVAVSADGKTVVWTSPQGNIFRTIDRGATWTRATGLAENSGVAIADRVDPKRFYIYDSRRDKLDFSVDGGASFATVPTVLVGGHGHLVATPGHAGDIWLCSEAGLFHSTDYGATFAHFADVKTGESLGFGKAATGSTYPALYFAGTANGFRGVFRSTDAGATWLRIDDDAHRYGWRGQAITGDPRIFGRVYLGTNGRGILYADPASDVPVQTAVKEQK